MNTFEDLKLRNNDSFEIAAQKLEEIVKLLDEGELTLDDTLALYEEGIRLYRFCHKKLDSVEHKISIALNDNESSHEAISLEDLKGDEG